MTEQAPSHERPPRPRVFIAAAAVLAVLIGWGAYGHWQQAADAAQAQQATEDFVPTVRVAEAKRIDAPVPLTLPGQTEAFDSAAIYARATGYVAERHVDIGSRVHRGDLLLRVSAPDVDAQLVQAQAQLGQYQAAQQQAVAQLQQAQANSSLARVTDTRTKTLAGEGWETKQNADNTKANVNTSSASVASAGAGIAVAVANVRAQAATVKRLQELTGFEQISAPFDGVVTARNVDVGDLVTADSATSPALLTVQADDVLRVSVQVPQSGAASLHAGLEASVTLPELPGRTFRGRVSRTSGSLDPTSRTLLVQVDVPNDQHALRPGLFVNVAFQIPRDAPGVELPSEALIFNSAGMQVAEVRPDDTIAMHRISIYRDFGTSVELRGGLSGGERLVLNAPADLADGSKVHVNAPPTARPPAGNTRDQQAAAGERRG